MQTWEDFSLRMDVSGGLAAPTAVVSNSRGVQIYVEVSDSVIEAFIMMFMVGAVEEIVTIKEVGWKETQCVRRLRLQHGLSPCWNVAWSRQELVEACAAGPTTCMGVAARVAYSS